MTESAKKEISPTRFVIREMLLLNSRITTATVFVSPWRFQGDKNISFVFVLYLDVIFFSAVLDINCSLFFSLLLLMIIWNKTVYMTSCNVEKKYCTAFFFTLSLYWKRRHFTWTSLESCHLSNLDSTKKVLTISESLQTSGRLNNNLRCARVFFFLWYYILPVLKLAFFQSKQ